MSSNALILALSGSASLTFNKDTNNLSVGNTVSATHFDNVSDLKLKKNVEPLSIPYSTVLNLNPVSFNWKENDEKSFGLIAQEVEEIIPEIVHIKEDGTIVDVEKSFDEYLGLD